MIAAIRGFLLLVATLYTALGVWCATAPGVTSSKVGLQAIGEPGRSEFFTVYGGLEVGIGAALFALAARNSTLRSGLVVCAAIHGGLVVFRSISFGLYDAMHGFTLNLAVGEWVIFLASGLLLALSREHEA